MRQRVVGTLVLGCLAIILIPVILDGEGIVAPPLGTNIPPAPVFDSAPVPEPERPVILSDRLPTATTGEPVSNTEPTGSPAVAPPAIADTITLPAVEPLPDPVPTESSKPAAASATSAAEPDALEAAVAAIMARTDTPAASADNTPERNAAGLPQSFVVRLGSFGDKANADALLQKLIAASHKAYTRPVQTANGVMQAVYVGPVLTRGEAVTLAGKLDTAFQLKGVVESYSPPALQ